MAELSEATTYVGLKAVEETFTPPARNGIALPSTSSMAIKRKAQDAFGRPNGHLSAFAAARLAKLTKPQSVVIPTEADDGDNLAQTIAASPYDGHRSEDTTAAAVSEDESDIAAGLPAPAPEVQLSTLHSEGSDFAQDDEDVLELRLRKDETVTCIGEYDLVLVSGLVSIYGALIHPNMPAQRVYAPSTHALPAVTARQHDTAIRIRSVGFRLKALGKLSPLFRSLWAPDGPRSFSILKSSSDDPLSRSLTPLEFDEHYKKVLFRLNARLDADERAPHIMAIGAKSSGKSTFNRLLCNMILSRPGRPRCVYLDLDPGQPEFGVPGQVSLVEVTAPILGPPFTHPAALQSRQCRLLRSHTLAAVSFRDDSGHYIACAADLIRHAPRDVPLIVNSCGWVTGLGASVLTDLVPRLGITDVVVLEPLDTSLLGFSGADARNVHRIPRRQARPSARTPAEQRAMQTMAYFHHRYSTAPDFLRYVSKPISSMRPWIVNYSNTESGVFAIMSYGQAPRPDFLAEVLDGAVVAMVLTEPNLLDADAVRRTSKEDLPLVRTNDHGFVTPLDPRHSQCIGIALVRGIDVKTKQLHLVTPLADEQIAKLLNQQVVLVRGAFDCPEWAYLEDLQSSEESGEVEGDRPWVSRRDTRVGIEGAVWRLRHPPLR